MNKMLPSYFFTKVLLLLILNFQVFGKSQIYSYRNNKRTSIDNLDVLKVEYEINDIDYFIVGDESKKKNPLVFKSPIRTGKIIALMLDAMQNLIDKNKLNIHGKLILSDWAVIGQNDLCEDDSNPDECPSLILQGTTSFSYRFNRKEVISLNSFFDEYMTTNYTLFSTKFIKQVEYDYSIDGNYVAVPLITDLRIIYFNIDTYDKVGIPYPPPLGRDSWTWNDLVKDVEAIDKYFEANNIESSPFEFYGLYDEEMKFFSAILRNYGVPTISSTDTCGYCSSERNLSKTVQAVDEIIKPLFKIIKKYS